MLRWRWCEWRWNETDIMKGRKRKKREKGDNKVKRVGSKGIGQCLKKAKGERKGMTEEDMKKEQRGIQAHNKS